MNILAIDTTADIESVAILKDGEVPCARSLKQRSTAAEVLTSEIEKIMSDQGLEFSDLDAIAVTRGPASFTSVRIGLACAKGLALATNKQLMSFDSLLVQAYNYRDFQGRIIVINDAKMDEFFVASFICDGNNLQEEKKSYLATIGNLSDIEVKEGDLVVGSGAKQLLLANSIIEGNIKVADENGEQILAESLAHMAFNCQDQGVLDLSPNYIRDPKIGKRKK